MKSILSTRLILVLILYVLTLFILRYLIHIWVFIPVRLYGSDELLTIGNHVLFNFIPYCFLILLKVSVISMMLYSGLLIFKHRYIEKIKFQDVFKIAVVSESVFLLRLVFILIYFLIINTDYTYEIYDYFSPFSLSSLFESESTVFNDLFQAINIFELLHILLLYWGIKTIHSSYQKHAVIIVLCFYFIPFILWELFWSTLWP